MKINSNSNSRSLATNSLFQTTAINTKSHNKERFTIIIQTFPNLIGTNSVLKMNQKCNKTLKLFKKTQGSSFIFVAILIDHKCW